MTKTVLRIAEMNLLGVILIFPTIILLVKLVDFYVRIFRSKAFPSKILSKMTDVYADGLFCWVVSFSLFENILIF